MKPTKQELDALRGLVEKATPGPYRVAGKVPPPPPSAPAGVYVY